MSEGDKESGNGKVHHLHSEAVASLAERTAHQLEVDERIIERLDESVEKIRRGDTDWQRSLSLKVDGLVDAMAKSDVRQRVILDGVMDVRAARFAWPKMISATLALLGGFSAVLVYLLLKH